MGEGRDCRDVVFARDGGRNGGSWERWCRLGVFVMGMLAASTLSPGELHHGPSAVTCGGATTSWGCQHLDPWTLPPHAKERQTRQGTFGYFYTTRTASSIRRCCSHSTALPN